MKNPFTVLIVDHSSDIGGAELSMEMLVTSMPKDKVTYAVVLPDAGPLVVRLREKGATVLLHRIESWRWWVESFDRALKFFITIPLQIVSLLQWVAFLRKTSPDIVHFNINRLVEPVIAARFLRIPSVMHFRDIPSRITPRFVAGKKNFYRLMNLADWWIANSGATANDIWPHARRPLSTIPNALDLSLYGNSDMRPSHGNRPTVAMIALLVPWKNHRAYLEVAQLVHSRVPDCLFLVAGSGEAEYERSLRNMAQSLGIEKAVRFLGHVEDIPALLASVDILVHMTDREPFGRVFLEAMAASRPVVAINNGGAREIVVDGGTGILTEEGKIEHMADAIVSLLTDKDLRRKMGQAGRKRVEEYYSAKSHVDSVFEVYENVIQNRNRTQCQPNLIQYNKIRKDTPQKL